MILLVTRRAGRALATLIRHHIALCIIKIDELGEVLEPSMSADQAGPVRHYHLAFD